jgi:hypothetical protein
MRPDKSLCARYQCGLGHQNCQVGYAGGLRQQGQMWEFKPALPPRRIILPSPVRKWSLGVFPHMSGLRRHPLSPIEDFTHAIEQRLPLALPGML